jgi:hypothetical protein
MNEWIHRQATWKPDPQQLIAMISLPVPSVWPSHGPSLRRSAKKFTPAFPGRMSSICRPLAPTTGFSVLKVLTTLLTLPHITF